MFFFFKSFLCFSSNPSISSEGISLTIDMVSSIMFPEIYKYSSLFTFFILSGIDIIPLSLIDKGINSISFDKSSKREKYSSSLENLSGFP